MSGAVISRVQVAAAHDGEAELVVALCFENGAESVVALDEWAVRHLMTACGADSADGLVGHGWERVRDALEYASNRFVAPGGAS